MALGESGFHGVRKAEARWQGLGADREVLKLEIISIHIPGKLSLKRRSSFWE